MEEADVLIFLILEFIFDYSFSPREDKLFLLVFVFHRGVPNAIFNLVPYLKNKGTVQFYSGT